MDPLSKMTGNFKILAKALEKLYSECIVHNVGLCLFVYFVCLTGHSMRKHTGFDDRPDSDKLPKPGVES